MADRPERLALLMGILELARWAPSGDNTQPWRFEVLEPARLRLHVRDNRQSSVYDLDGRSTLLSVGGLIETVAIAASCHGHRLALLVQPDTGVEGHSIFDLSLIADEHLTPDPLAEFISRRSVQRRPMQTRPLNMNERLALEQSVSAYGHVHWKLSWPERWRMARLLNQTLRLRLRMPEGYQAHRQTIEWEARYSEDRIPDQALGVGPWSLLMMRFALKSWRRAELARRISCDNWPVRLQMASLPALACAGHFALQPLRTPESALDYLQAGRAMQRFWLTATSLGLQLQPEHTPIVFARYARQGLQFSSLPDSMARAQSLRRQLQAILGEHAADAATFMGRIGHGKAAQARSVRHPLQRLMER